MVSVMLPLECALSGLSKKKRERCGEGLNELANKRKKTVSHDPCELIF